MVLLAYSFKLWTKDSEFVQLVNVLYTVRVFVHPDT